MVLPADIQIIGVAVLIAAILRAALLIEQDQPLKALKLMLMTAMIVLMFAVASAAFMWLLAYPHH